MIALVFAQLIEGVPFPDRAAMERPTHAPVEIGVAEGELFARGEGAVRASSGAPAHPSAMGAFGGDLHFVWALVGHRLGPAVAADLDFGGGAPAGFAHSIHLEPLGLGVVLGRLGYFTATTGAGGGVVTGSVPLALEIPASARLAVDVAARARLLLDARLLWAFADERRSGAPYVPFADEARFGVGARFGRTWDEYRYADSGGYFFRLEHSERMGASYVGLAVGYALGGAY
jgi:hypothetical protein